MNRQLTRTATASRRIRRRRSRAARLWPRRAKLRRLARAFRVAPPALQLGIGVVALLVLWFAANALVQVVRKPTELFFPVSGVALQDPAGDLATRTRRSSARTRRRRSRPELLAALAQIEASGNPVARTYWRWRLAREPFELYRPASSAVGMYQITDGTFAEAKRYCIHDHAVVEDGPWHDLALVLVQRPLLPGGAEPRRRADLGVPRPRG